MNCPIMQQVITRLATKHGLDLTQPGAWIRLAHDPYEPLLLFVEAPHQLSIAHLAPGAQPGAEQFDPSILFYTVGGVFRPLGIQMLTGYACQCATASTGAYLPYNTARSEEHT